MTMTRIDARARWRTSDLAALALGLGLLLAWDASGLDLAAARWYGTAQGFPWREHWWTRDVLHGGGRVLAGLVLTALALNVLRPFTPGLDRRERLGWLLVTLTCLVAVPALKRGSLTSCPWDLGEFGGVALYVSHWQAGFADGGAGHCFPSGHAVAAFAFLSGCFVLRDAHPRAARAWLAGVVTAGLLFGWAQWARGAHFPSHTAWSAWACWAISLALSPFVRAGGAARPALRPAAPPAPRR